MQTLPFSRRLGLIAQLIIGTLGAASLPQLSTLTVGSPPVRPLADLVIFDDEFAAGWDPNWSFGATFTTDNARVHSGTASLSVDYTAGYGGLSLHVPGGNGATLSASGYRGVSFWARGADTQPRSLNFSIQTASEGGESAPVSFTAPPGAWQKFSFAWSALGNPAQIARITIQNAVGDPVGNVYLDDIQLDTSTTDPPATSTPTRIPGAAIQLSVDAGASRKPISPYIYGLHYTTATLAAELKLPVRRWGGNDTSRYNWQFDLSNNGSDYYFENNKTRDLSADQFIQRDRSSGTKTIMTVPMTGWVAKNDVTACGYSTAKYEYVPLPYPNNSRPATDPFRAACGSGIVSYRNNQQDKPVFYGPTDATDTSMAVGEAFVQAWVEHLTTQFGTSSNGGVLFYNLDNEPDLWHETHRDIHPEGQTYDSLRDDTIRYATAIKAVDPGAQILGADFSSWLSYFYSGADRKRWEVDDFSAPDNAAHGGIPITAWFLQQMRGYEQLNGKRLIDYLDLHYYPQNGVSLRNAGDAATQARRLRSTRSLWDPSYLDESYIADADDPDMRYVRLIPRMQAWVDANYPGTKLAITEYNWGALDHINGALAQADILGIFGREGVQLATLFDTPYGDGLFTPSSPGAFAFRMYRNYDGTGSRFGDESVKATSSDQDKLAIYAARQSDDGSLTLMVVNKTGGALNSRIALNGFSAAGSAEVYRYSSQNIAAIRHLPPQALEATGFDAGFPANSITLFRLTPDTTPGTRRKVYMPIVRRDFSMDRLR